MARGLGREIRRGAVGQLEAQADAGRDGPALAPIRIDALAVGDAPGLAVIPHADHRGEPVLPAWSLSSPRHHGGERLEDLHLDADAHPRRDAAESLREGIVPILLEERRQPAVIERVPVLLKRFFPPANLSPDPSLSHEDVVADHGAVGRERQGVHDLERLRVRVPELLGQGGERDAALGAGVQRDGFDRVFTAIHGDQAGTALDDLRNRSGGHRSLLDASGRPDRGRAVNLE